MTRHWEQIPVVLGRIGMLLDLKEMQWIKLMEGLKMAQDGRQLRNTGKTAFAVS